MAHAPPVPYTTGRKKDVLDIKAFQVRYTKHFRCNSRANYQLYYIDYDLLTVAV